MALPASLMLTPADSAHVVGEVYNLSLLATLVIGVAALALVALRRGSAGGRALACRAAVVALLALAVGHLLPVRPMLWVMPEGVAAPLIALGKAQLGAGPVGNERVDAGPHAMGGVRAATAPARPHAADRAASLAPGLLLTYLAGILVVALVTARARRRLGRLLATATRCDGDAWHAVLADAATAAGLAGARFRQLQLYTTDRLDVPCTWPTRAGAVVVLPGAATTWRPAHLRAALVHELSHVRHGDAQMALAARVACALFWFHPGAWWLAARLAAESERACDDRVLLGGVRRSDYAELLAVAGVRGAIPAPGMALVGHGGVRARLAAIVDTSRPLRAPSHAVIALVMAGGAAVGGPLGTVRMAPTRAVLATLMHDAAWESRAYAVVRLAQRADSVEVARTAARLDPSPQVRAWATYAVRQSSFLH